MTKLLPGAAATLWAATIWPDSFVARRRRWTRIDSSSRLALGPNRGCAIPRDYYHGLLEPIFSSAGLEYRIAGGLATYFYVEEAAPDAGRLTKDIDIFVRRDDLADIVASAESFGFRRHGDMLRRTSEPANRRALHLVFAGDGMPELAGGRRMGGLKLLPLSDLVRMLLTSFRNQDGAHIIDLHEAGLITPEIEAGLSPLLRQRLAEARARG